MVSDNKPPVGKNPFQAEIAANTSANLAAFTVVSPRPVPRDLDGDWFREQEEAAENGIAAIAKLTGWMEVRFVPETTASKSGRELLEAVQNSEIKTFGWPIGVTLQSRDEWRPKPAQNGIKAEISIKESELTERSSYDYWALTTNADFFLLQSLFEDMRSDKKKIFFNTRIVRVAETFMFAATLYHTLGFSADTELQARIKHKGLKGRVLSSSSPLRPLYEDKVSEANESERTLKITLGSIHENLPQLVRAVCAPMFALFDHMEFGDHIYDEIVGQFVLGSVT